MYLLRIIAFLIISSGLVGDYSKDKGRHKKAKIVQAICLITLAILYTDVIQQIIMIFRYPGEMWRFITTDVGIVPGHMRILLFIAYMIVGTFILVLTYQMSTRNDKARLSLIRLLPLLALIEIFNFYIGWMGAGDVGSASHLPIMLTGFIIVGGIVSAIIMLYNSRFMKAFYGHTVLPPQVTDETILDADATQYNIEDKTDING